MRSFIYIFLSAAVLLTGFSSCRKLIDAGEPKTLLTSEATFSDVKVATTAMLGIYNSLEGYFNINTTILPGLSADELISYSTPVSRYYTNSLNASVNDDFWSNFYKCIYQCNLLIEKTGQSTGIKASDKVALIAEATFLRAYFHFYLVNYFGDIPYITNSDYNISKMAARQPAKDSVYPRIIKDLLFAEENLPDTYYDGVRTRANKQVATALLARVYLYDRSWALAEKTAARVIAHADYMLEPLENVFLTGSQEAILQLSPNVSSQPFATEARSLVLTNVPASSTGKVSVSDFLYNAFEDNDKRKTEWIGTYTKDNNKFYHYAAKYKSTVDNPVEYSVVMRLSEQYLIRAEAKAQQNNVDGALEDLTGIRERAGLLPLSPPMTQAECLRQIMHERQTELFVEYGHRWLDLKRTGNIDAVMQTVCAQKGGVWKSSWQLYPIPQVQLNADPNMTNHQNQNY